MTKKPPPKKPAAAKKPAPEKAPAAETAPAPGPDLARLMPLIGLGVAVWASLPQYSGPKLYVEASKEVADHIIPAILVLMASIVGIMAGRRPQGPGALRLIAGMVVLLAGLWMMATHIPLLLQTMRGGPDAASWAATIYHLASAMAVFGLGLLWSTVTWAEADDSDQPATQAQK
ncbi:MAG TPA: hypothetical protein VM388_14765 [Acidimicrobiales bacterium]|nr:hypothetical protein [Acidimicrobiales bacterium]HWI02547.1 hypothetical protein [Acidimicrobiales bacterium]